MKKYLLICMAIAAAGVAEAKAKKKEKPKQQKAEVVVSSKSYELSRKPFTRDLIMEFGDTAAGTKYVWGGSTWSPDNRSGAGPDCSGLFQKMWQYPYFAYPEVEVPHLSTKQIVDPVKFGLPWKIQKIDYSKALRADAVAYRRGEAGHVGVVSRAEDTGLRMLHAPGRGKRIGYGFRSYAKMEDQGFVVIRRNGIR